MVIIALEGDFNVDGTCTNLRANASATGLSGVVWHQQVSTSCLPLGGGEDEWAILFYGTFPQFNSGTTIQITWLSTVSVSTAAMQAIYIGNMPGGFSTNASSDVTAGTCAGCSTAIDKVSPFAKNSILTFGANWALPVSSIGGIVPTAPFNAYGLDGASLDFGQMQYDNNTFAGPTQMPTTINYFLGSGTLFYQEAGFTFYNPSGTTTTTGPTTTSGSSTTTTSTTTTTPSCTAPFACINIITSPNGLGGALTVNGTAYATPHTFHVPVGSHLNLAASTVALDHAFNTYTFSKWSQGGARVQTYIVVNSTTLIIYYGGSFANCNNANPLIELENGCYFPASVDALAGPLGRGPYLAFVLLGANVAIYHKTQAVWLSLIVLWVTGAVFGFILPGYVGVIAQVFLYLAVAGIAVKLILRIT
jgi:hypothetical protein